MNKWINSIFAISLLWGCGGASSRSSENKPMSQTAKEAPNLPGRFSEDLSFLKQHTEIEVLRDPSGTMQVAVAPQYQGRVMTSTGAGADGVSFGWINREVIAARQRQPHMTALGGEDRFWVGPEGGQYGFYFPPKAPFDFDHWQVPEPIDWGGWSVVNKTNDQITFEKSLELINYQSMRFNLKVERTIHLLSLSEIANFLAVTPAPSVKAVAYESVNTITNTGEQPWNQGSGLVSIWILGMFVPSPSTTVIIPYRAGTAEKRGPVVNDRYFGKIPADRLRVEDSVLFFKADGKRRGKIGIARPRAFNKAGSFDSDRGILTVIQFNLPEPPQNYLNSMWEIQDKPYDGDVINSYNDGPPEPGKKPMGPFYEIETSSPALELNPTDKYTHTHRTIHLQGTSADLDPIARATLGVALETITSALPK
jgi:hypothetical protein